mmetsp:Transcript_4068/g.5909  ORF Transcript_4068/g.5909 Transcript_4068/m.5909 type:complete len:81 (+) Transcript_4068:54-296(+)
MVLESSRTKTRQLFGSHFYDDAPPLVLCGWFLRGTSDESRTSTRCALAVLCSPSSGHRIFFHLTPNHHHQTNKQTPNKPS